MQRDVINQTLQIAASDIGAQLPFHLRCYKVPLMCWCLMSDIIIGLTLLSSLTGLSLKTF